MSMRTHAEYKAQRTARDDEFRRAYDDLEEEYKLRSGIVRARLEKGLSQAELAEQLGTTQSAISRMEIGEFNPRVDTLRRLAEVLGVEFRITGNGPRVVRARHSAAKKSSAA